MTFDTLPLVAAGLLSVAIFWWLPERHRQNGVAVFTCIVLFVIAPATALVMLGSIVVVQQVMARADGMAFIDALTVLIVAALSAVLFLSRDVANVFGVPWLIVGLAYSTLRHIHVLVDWRLGRIKAPTLGSYLRYHLLLPVLAAGPIHRLPHFERQCQRRRWDTSEFFSGAERVLVGFTLFVVIGEYVLGSKIMHLFGPAADRTFAADWLASAIDWLRIYATFSGLTDIALGLCLMMGLRLEENFNKPWKAHSLVDFWTRWHMTLSLWCRDYVYMPVAVWFRSPLIGIFSAMLVLGLWHETSWYYLLWGPYQAFGIAMSHLYWRVGDPLRLARLPDRYKSLLAPLAILAWLSSARPVITMIVP